MLRLLWQELLFRRNALIGWGIGLCCFPLVYLGIYPQVAEEMSNLADLAVYQVMGVGLGSLEDWIGSTVILFVPLLASVYAIINATATLAGEEADGRLEMVVTLPIPRWQVVAAKALALSITILVILLAVSLVTAGVFVSIGGADDTELAAADMIFRLLETWPLVFAVAMISFFLAAFCAGRRAAALIATVILVVGYFGSNLAGMVSALEPLRFLFVFTYLDTSGSAVVAGQQPADLLVLLVIGVVSFGLAVFFFQQRDITVGVWPWQRARPAAE